MHLAWPCGTYFTNVITSHNALTIRLFTLVAVHMDSTHATTATHTNERDLSDRVLPHRKPSARGAVSGTALLAQTHDPGHGPTTTLCAEGNFTLAVCHDSNIDTVGTMEPAVPDMRIAGFAFELVTIFAGATTFQANPLLEGRNPTPIMHRITHALFVLFVLNLDVIRYERPDIL